MNAQPAPLATLVNFLHAVASDAVDYKEERNGHSSRAESAADLYQRGLVVPGRVPSLWLVCSRTDRRRWYEVNLPGWECECEDWRRRNVCAHLLAAGIAEAMRAEAEAQPEPATRGVPLSDYLASKPAKPAPQPAYTPPQMVESSVPGRSSVAVLDAELEALINEHWF